MLGLGASALFLLGSSFQLTVEMFDYLECELNLFQTGESFPPISPGFHGQCLVPSLFATWTSHASPYTLQSTGSGTWRLQALRPSFSSGAFAESVISCLSRRTTLPSLLASPLRSKSPKSVHGLRPQLGWSLASPVCYSARLALGLNFCQKGCCLLIGG